MNELSFRDLTNQIKQGLFVYNYLNDTIEKIDKNGYFESINYTLQYIFENEIKESYSS